MSNRFDYCLQFVLAAEGGKVDDPADRGGRTNKGVTQITYTGWRLHQRLPDKDVWEATDDEIRAIYREDYWVPSKCPILPEPVDLVTFDTAVNMGVGRAIRFLQTALGVAADGQFGPKSIDALHEEIAANRQDDLGMQIIRLRADRYDLIVKNDPVQARFRKGWGNRLAHLTEAINHDVA